MISTGCDNQALNRNLDNVLRVDALKEASFKRVD